jgi:3-methyladenine DNA glycosylase Tag
VFAIVSRRFLVAVSCPLRERPMPRSAPPDADPREIFPFPVGETPLDDRAYFEMLSWFVFGAGLNWRVLRAKWPNFLRAFDGFDIAAVAAYREPKIDALLADAGIIRNGKKILGTVENAGAMQQIAEEHGDMTRWLRTFGGDSPALQKAVRKRFHHIGETTGRLFLACCGVLEYPTWEPTARQRTGKR